MFLLLSRILIAEKLAAPLNLHWKIEESFERRYVALVYMYDHVLSRIFPVMTNSRRDAKGYRKSGATRVIARLAGTMHTAAIVDVSSRNSSCHKSNGTNQGKEIEGVIIYTTRCYNLRISPGSYNPFHNCATNATDINLIGLLRKTRVKQDFGNAQ